MDKQAKQIFWYVVGAVALAAWMIFTTSGCGGCMGCGPATLDTISSHPAACKTTCGTEVWYGDGMAPDCDRINKIEQAALECFNNSLPGVSSAEKMCNGLIGSAMSVIALDGYGKTWTGPRLVVEIYRGGDWRVNSYTHELGHVAGWIFKRDADPDHSEWCELAKDPTCVFNVYGAIRCTQDRISAIWRQ